MRVERKVERKVEMRVDKKVDKKVERKVDKVMASSKTKKTSTMANLVRTATIPKKWKNSNLSVQEQEPTPEKPKPATLQNRLKNKQKTQNVLVVLDSKLSQSMFFIALLADISLAV